MIVPNTQTLLSSISLTVLQEILEEHRAFMNPDMQAEIDHFLRKTETVDEDECRERLNGLLEDEQYLRKLIDSFSDIEKEVIYFFIYHIGRDYLTYRQIKHKVKGIQPNKFHLGLTTLRRKGIIYTLRRPWGEEAYILPEDLRERLYKYSLEQAPESDMDDESLPSVTRMPSQEEYQPIWVELFLLLDQFRYEIHHLIPLTKKGTLHKRFLRKIENVIRHKEISLDDRHVRVAHPETYSTQLAVMLDFLTREQLLEWREDGVQLNLSLAHEWWKKSRIDIRDSFLAYWMHFAPEDPWLERWLQDALYDRQSSSWIPVLRYVEWWEHHYALPPVKDLQMKIQQFVRPLVQFGFIEYGQTENKEQVYRWCHDEDSAYDIWVQPNLEIFCVGHTPLHVLWTLAEVCDVVEWENMILLRISKEKYEVYLDSGKSLSQWLDGINRLTSVPVPQAFIDQLERWRKEKQKIVVQPVHLLTLSDEQMKKAVSTWCQKQNIPFDELSPIHIAVPEGVEEALYKLLEKKQIGYKVVLNEMKHELEPSVQPSLLQVAPSFNEDLKVESVFPELTEAIPGWNRFPDMWVKQLCSYHEQTKKDIISKALEYELPVKIETKEGQIQTLKPQSCQVEKGRWIVKGHQQQKHSLTDINRIQLLFPF